MIEEESQESRWQERLSIELDEQDGKELWDWIKLNWTKWKDIYKNGLVNIYQTYWNVSLNRHWCNPCYDHRGHRAMSTAIHIDFHANCDMDHIPR